MKHDIHPGGERRWSFIWSWGVIRFGIPVALISGAWAYVRQHDTLFPLAAGDVFGMLLGVTVGGIVGGILWGWVMWTFFGRYGKRNGG